MMAFWLVQALTGILLVFGGELDDATLKAPHVATDLAAIDAALARRTAADPGKRVIAVRATAGKPDRYDVTLGDAGKTATLRIDGAGHTLRYRAPGKRIGQGGLFVLAYDLHESLLSGRRGEWLVGVSGLLLLSSIGLGAVLAWPARGQWRNAVRPRSPRSTPARMYSWHRAVGLWAVAPALLSIGCGTAMVFSAQAGADAAAPLSAPPATGKPIAMAAAIDRARSRFPRAAFSGVRFPTAEAPYYTVQLRQPGEAGRIYGSTQVSVSAADGRIVDIVDPFAMAVGARTLDLLYPIHTGEIAGIGGRIAALLIGLWLVAMTIFGFRLWLSRRPKPSVAATVGTPYEG